MANSSLTLNNTLALFHLALQLTLQLTSLNLGKRKAKALDIHMHFCGFSQYSFIHFFSFHLGCRNPCITAYGLPSLADNSNTWQHFHLFYKACTKGYAANSCLANPDNEAVSHSITCSTNL